MPVARVSHAGVQPARPRALVAATARPRSCVAYAAQGERLRLHNLSPAKGSRRKATRKGRGHAAGQGQTCGYGMRGQNARSGPSTRPGFEGGQMPLYRRVPKLKGIAGGMGRGLTKHVTINLKTLSEKFSEGEEVTIQALKDKQIVDPSGHERDLGLKILGDGDMAHALTITAESISASAKEKIEAAGGTVTIVPKRAKWTRKQHERNVRAGTWKKPNKDPKLEPRRPKPKSPPPLADFKVGGEPVNAGKWASFKLAREKSRARAMARELQTAKELKKQGQSPAAAEPSVAAAGAEGE